MFDKKDGKNSQSFTNWVVAGFESVFAHILTFSMFIGTEEHVKWGFSANINIGV